jgi:hypothetical protein
MENSETWNWVSLFKLIGFGIGDLEPPGGFTCEIRWAGALQIAR